MRKLAEEIAVGLVEAGELAGDETAAAKIIGEVLHRRLFSLLCAADSELSAIAHGRPPAPARDLETIYFPLRRIYEGRGVN